MAKDEAKQSLRNQLCEKFRRGCFYSAGQGGLVGGGDALFNLLHVLALKEEHIALEVVPLVEELLADFLQVVHGGEVEVGDHPQS